MEKYIVINEFNNYAVSNFGNIKNIKKNKLLTLNLNLNGYYTYTFCQNGIKKTFEIHRLVALYFIKNPNNYPYVNHIDGNKGNNRVENLEWSFKSQNEINVKFQEKPILAENILNKERIAFKSISEASAFLGINMNAISKVLHKKRNKTHNYKFYFI